MQARASVRISYEFEKVINRGMLPDTTLYERLTLRHDFLPFDCGDEDLNEYLYLI